MPLWGGWGPLHSLLGMAGRCSASEPGLGTASGIHVRLGDKQLVFFKKDSVFFKQPVVEVLRYPAARNSLASLWAGHWA